MEKNWSGTLTIWNIARYMTYEDYLKYTHNITSKLNPPDRTKNITFIRAQFVVDFSCYSIHSIEPVSATFIFYQILEQSLRYFFWMECRKIEVEHDLYTESITNYSKKIDGILIKFLSVELKKGQDIQTINAACNSLLTRVKRHIEGYEKMNEKSKDVLKKR